MSSRSAQRRGITRALRVASLLLALAGLFAMHGLGDHGTTDAAHHSMAAMPAMTGAPVEAAHSAHHGAQAAADLGALALAPLEDSDGPADPGALGMCVAVLLLVTAASLALARHHGARLRVVLQPVRRPPTRGRSPDPPDLARLSVQRC